MKLHTLDRFRYCMARRGASKTAKGGQHQLFAGPAKNGAVVQPASQNIKAQISISRSQQRRSFQDENGKHKANDSGDAGIATCDIPYSGRREANVVMSSVTTSFNCQREKAKSQAAGVVS
jgi:hypothetical protein